MTENRPQRRPDARTTRPMPAVRRPENDNEITAVIPPIRDAAGDGERQRATPRRTEPATPQTRLARRRAERNQRPKGVMILLAAVAAVIALAAGVFVFGKLTNDPPVAADYEGPAGPSVVIEVKPGETADEISHTLAGKDVVASAAAFYEAAVANPKMNEVHPGFYYVPSKAPASEVVTALVDPAARVGALLLSEGRQLHDTRDVNTQAVKEGIYRKIAAASCLGAKGQQKCLTYDDLNNAGASTDLAALGVPDWALDGVRKVPDRDRQLEGLIASGSWNFDPTKSATEILRHLVVQSTEMYKKSGILDANKTGQLTPYQKLIAASLVERESLPQDFPKVARVILNRLAINQALQFDSTVNYALDTTEVATTDADRAKKTPWNTYAMPGLPATPISSPSLKALEAVEVPAAGPWRYFVTIDKQGTTLFTESYDEHLRNIDKAAQSGILQSGR